LFFGERIEKGERGEWREEREYRRVRKGERRAKGFHVILNNHDVLFNIVMKRFGTDNDRKQKTDETLLIRFD